MGDVHDRVNKLHDTVYGGSCVGENHMCTIIDGHAVPEGKEAWCQHHKHDGCTYKEAGTCEGKGVCVDIQSHRYDYLNDKKTECESYEECTWFQGGLIGHVKRNTDAIRHGTCTGAPEMPKGHRDFCQEISTYAWPEDLEHDCKREECIWTPSVSELSDRTDNVENDIHGEHGVHDRINHAVHSTAQIKRPLPRVQPK